MTLRDRTSRPERFGPEFAATITTAFRECGGGRRIMIVLAALIAILGFAVHAQALLVLGLIGAPLLLISRARPTAPSDLPATKRRVPRDPEPAVSSDGHHEFEMILARIQGLVGRDIAVTFGEGDPDWRPVVRLEGALRSAQDITDATTGGEVLRFAVGDNGAFYLARAPFEQGIATSRHEPDMLLLILDHDVVLMIHETAPTDP